MRIVRLVFPFVFIGMASCARAPIMGEREPIAPRVLYQAVCGASAPGQQVSSAKGSVWVRAKSKEASGQFPAFVEVFPTGNFKMEVINLLGGTEAILKVEGTKYVIEIPKEPEKRKREGTYSWGGIPLHWAAQLFQGRIPCPPVVAIPEMDMTLGPEGVLVLETKPSLEREAERFSYRLKPSAGTFWPETMRWERKGIAPLTVDFEFGDPETETRSPLKWSARSSLGEVKVRWKEREWKK